MSGPTNEGQDDLVEITKGLSDLLILDLTLIFIESFGSTNLTVLETNLRDSIVGVELMVEIWKGVARLSSILALPFSSKVALPLFLLELQGFPLSLHTLQHL